MVFPIWFPPSLGTKYHCVSNSVLSGAMMRLLSSSKPSDKMSTACFVLISFARCDSTSKKTFFPFCQLNGFTLLNDANGFGFIFAISSPYGITDEDTQSCRYVLRSNPFIIYFFFTQADKATIFPSCPLDFFSHSHEPWVLTPI